MYEAKQKHAPASYCSHILFAMAGVKLFLHTRSRILSKLHNMNILHNIKYYTHIYCVCVRAVYCKLSHRNDVRVCVYCSVEVKRPR